MMFEITQEEFEGLMLTTIEPTLLVLLLLAFTIFLGSSYKKAEMRLFSLTLIIFAVAIIFAMAGLFLIEGILVMVSSCSSVLAALVLRFKTKKTED